MSAGRRWEKVPTSRAVPQADGWPGQRERAVPRLGDLPGQQVDVVDEVVGPDAADVLVEAHGPERHHLGLGVGVELRERHSRSFETPVSSAIFSSV